MHIFAKIFLLVAVCCFSHAYGVMPSAENKDIYFYQCTNNQYVYCEPGSELIAQEIGESLDDSKKMIEEKQLPFVGNQKFYVYQSLENFLKNTGANGYMKAVVIHQSIHISPTINSFHEFGAYDDTIKKIIVHELSHLNLLQNYGEETYHEIPSWFIEGLATYSSGGAGAESVTATQARNLLAEGIGFSPGKDYEFPTKSGVIKINPQIYYKQAESFVRFIYEIKPIKFKKLIVSMRDGKNFYDVFFETYQLSVFDMWRLYINQVLRDY